MSHAPIQLLGGELELIEAALVEGEAAKPPTITMTAYTGAAVRVKAYKDPVVVDLAGMEGINADLPLLVNHSQDRVFGHGRASIEAGVVKIAGIQSFDSPESKAIVAAAKNGFPWKASIGFLPTVVEQVAKGKSATVNGMNVTGPVSIARKGVLYETSVVAIGADGATRTEIAATFDPGDSQVTTTTETDEKPNPDIQAVLDAASVEETRQNKIAAILQSALDRGVAINTVREIAGKAVEARWSPEQTELTLLRESRPVMAGQSRNQDGQDYPLVLEAALALSSKLPGVETMYDARVLEQADRKFRSGLSLMEFVGIAARRNGCHFDSHRDLKPILRAAFEPIEAASVSTFSVSGILGNVANKMIRVAFDAVESSWREISAIASVKDFKAKTSYTLTGDMQYEKVGPGGELKHGTIGETSYTNQADTYGKLFGLSRRDLINDDLGAFNTLGARMGRGAALKLNDVFWTEFMDNSAFFTTGRANYATGSTTALSIASLTQFGTLFDKLTDPDGKPMALPAELLLVPPELEPTAIQLMTSMMVSSTEALTSGGGQFGTANPHVNKYRVVKSRYLSNTSYTGNSTTAWYLLANPSVLPVIETVFLNGQERPIVESADADFDTLGVQFRGYHDFGVNLQEYRAGVKSKGAS